MELLKSPMNYIGNKFRLLPQMLAIFPKEINGFLDLFCGGLDVSVNVQARHKIANDINCYLIEIYKAFQKDGYESVINYLHKKIEEYDLSKTNQEGYIAFRTTYNNSDKRNPLDLYLLMNYSFNYQIRFNNQHEYNNPFGKDRSSFNSSLQSRLNPFIERISEINFISSDFRDVSTKGVDFIYADPAYTLSIGSYNDGKRGFKGWRLQDDIDLMNYLDEADRKGIQFALSDVLEHKGQLHKELIEWSGKYRVHDMTCSYDNCNYQTQNKKHKTREVLITNF